jgi:hypothetical protein
MSTLIERIVLGILLAGSVYCGYFFLNQRTGSDVVRMEDRLNKDIAALEMEPQYFFPRPQVDYVVINKTLGQKKLLWKELVPPPPPPPAVEAPPNLIVKLKGVTPSKRRQIGSGDSLRVSIKTPAAPRGDWMSVGDKYKDMTIVAITKDYVEFKLIHKKKEYTHQIKRK